VSAPSKQQSSAAALEDLLGIGAPAPAAPAAAGGLTAGAERWLLPLLVRTDGVLFEDDQLQVGLKVGARSPSARPAHSVAPAPTRRSLPQSEYQGPRARVALYIGNKSPTAAMSNVSVVISPVSGLAVQVQQAVSAIVAPMAQNVHIVLISCESEFSEVPTRRRRLPGPAD
jgi:hypothetical protein